MEQSMMNACRAWSPIRAMGEPCICIGSQVVISALMRMPPPPPPLTSCMVSQVWVKPDLRPDGLVYWGADSDSQLTKGLAALLVLGLSGCTPQEITQVCTYVSFLNWPAWQDVVT